MTTIQEQFVDPQKQSGERHQFLKREKANYNLSQKALERIVCRGLGQVVRKEISTKEILPLVNSEAHILCSDIDVSSRDVAFGRWAVPKLKKELLSRDPLISKKAILSLLDMVHDPEKAVEVIRLQVVPRLVRLMTSEDAFVRQNVLMILQTLAMQPHGKLAIVQHTFIMKNLLTLLSDSEDNVRLSAANAVLSLARWYLGVEEMIKKCFVITIIQRLNTELDDNIMIPLLETLELLLDHDMAVKNQALQNEGIALAILLRHDDSKIRSLVASVLAQLARHDNGKKEILNHKADLLLILTNLLEDEEVTVKTNAAAVLMFVLCTTEGKKRCLKLQTSGHLLQCAQYFRQPSLQMNSIKALTSLAESPGGQNLLKTNIQLIESIQPADNLVKKFKDNLITVINRVI